MTVSRDFFETQVVELLGGLHGVARRLTSNDTDAEDLVAETVARAWRKLGTLQNEEAFRPWIFRILNNTFISDRRRCARRARTEPLACAEHDDDAGFSLFEQMHQPFLLWFSTPEQEFLDRLLCEDLDRALATLPGEHRLIVVLSDVEGFSYAEIAEMLKIPVGTVRSRLARARGKLQKVLWEQAQTYGLTGDATKPCQAARSGVPRTARGTHRSAPDDEGDG